ncbi:MAG TPA: acetylxylan esterase, partial [Pirellulales bacterium]|nr:acetylxylan esterase [Pirellulales bacterium]
PGNGRSGAAPGRLHTPDLTLVKQELQRAEQLTKGLDPAPKFQLVASGEGGGLSGSGLPGSPAALDAFLGAFGGKLAAAGGSPTNLRGAFDANVRLKRQLDEMTEYTQHLMREGEYTRRNFWAKADRGSRSTEKWQETAEPYRDYFYDDVVGRFDRPLLKPEVRSRKVYDEAKFTGYDVVMNVFPDVFAYGILLLPKDLKPGERRPVVVCQHGLEGRPQDVADPKINNPAYNQFALRLAERGFITFSPQNPYIFTDRFRSLQRKSNPLKKTLFSTIVPQHQQAVNWLASLPMVDPERIGFYGLSYGGKSAMRIPALVKEYCLSICSADFNEWIWKNTSTRWPGSYIGTGEYEIFEFDLGDTFNYAEMAGLIAPRPFMVERGHRDGVGPDEWVAYEYAKVRLLYADLKIPERTTIEFFDGPHTIHGVGTFAFLHQHLKWPEK